MAEPLKYMYNKEFLSSFADKVKKSYDDFNSISFINAVLADDWNGLELKGRIRRIAETLGTFLPQKYEEALKVLFSIDELCTGFQHIFFPEFVAIYGQEDKYWDLSMKALERFTERSSSEFAVRPFIKIDPKKMMDQMLIWSKSDNEHVRRLSSEGCRPRLPWGEALSIFKSDPTPVLSILEQLKEDPSIYVRKSVANNLNDISKDNAEIMLETLKRWKGDNSNTNWIIRHSARTLVRKSHPEVMDMFGYEQSIAKFISIDAKIYSEPDEIKIGENCELIYELNIPEGELVHIRVEYAIDFVKAKGNISRKLFLLSDRVVPGGKRIHGKRTHKWKDLTTRKHYAGEHRIILMVNGCEVASTVLRLDL